MIGFAIPPADLLARVEAHCPGWSARAQTRTNALAAGGADPEFPNLWREIKEVYIKLQHAKCAYCEKKLEAQPIEHDVEHYRPIKKVARWRVPRSLAAQVTLIRQPARGSEPGYKLLAYNPLNYAASCKVCNTILKKNFFPIAGTRDVTERDPSSMMAERPFLCYPIGGFDEDPESLIEFYGLTPRPKAGDSGCQRALVAIAIFPLNNSRRRGELFEDRARHIVTLYLILERRDKSSSAREVRQSEKLVRYFTSDRAPHANCLRSFHRLYQSDRPAAENIFRRAEKLLNSYVGSV